MLNSHLGHLSDSLHDIEQLRHVLSHDVRDPIREALQCLQMNSDAVQPVALALEKALARIEACNEYVNLAQANFRDSVDVEVILQDILTEQLDRIKEVQADIKVVYPLPCIKGNAAQVRRLFWELIDNGLTYCGNGLPKLVIRAEKEGSVARFFVRDEGAGFDPVYSSLLLSLFRQLDPESDVCCDKLGVGLSFAKRIVELHGGVMGIEAEEGDGCTVSFTLPLVEDERGNIGE